MSEGGDKECQPTLLHPVQGKISLAVAVAGGAIHQFLQSPAVRAEGPCHVSCFVLACLFSSVVFLLCYIRLHHLFFLLPPIFPPESPLTIGTSSFLSIYKRLSDIVNSVPCTNLSNGAKDLVW